MRARPKRHRVRRYAVGQSLALLLSSAAGCGERSNPPREIVGLRDPELVSVSLRSSFVHPVQRVVRDTAAWRAVWDSVTAYAAAPSPRPAVDFAREMLVVVGPGRSSPGIPNVGVEGYTVHRDTMNVYVRAAFACAAGAAIAEPVSVVRVPSHGGVIRIIKRTTMPDCLRSSNE